MNYYTLVFVFWYLLNYYTFRYFHVGYLVLLKCFLLDIYLSRFQLCCYYLNIESISSEIRKSLTKIAKQAGCEALTEWIKPAENHLHWSATSTQDGNGLVIWAKFQSYLDHIVDKHTNLPNPLFNRCAHGDDIAHRKWLSKGG